MERDAKRLRVSKIALRANATKNSACVKKASGAVVPSSSSKTQDPFEKVFDICVKKGLDDHLSWIDVGQLRLTTKKIGKHASRMALRRMQGARIQLRIAVPFGGTLHEQNPRNSNSIPSSIQSACYVEQMTLKPGTTDTFLPPSTPRPYGSFEWRWSQDEANHTAQQGIRIQISLQPVSKSRQSLNLGFVQMDRPLDLNIGVQNFGGVRVDVQRNDRCQSRDSLLAAYDGETDEEEDDEETDDGSSIMWDYRGLFQVREVNLDFGRIIELMAKPQARVPAPNRVGPSKCRLACYGSM